METFKVGDQAISQRHSGEISGETDEASAKERRGIGIDEGPQERDGVLGKAREHALNNGGRMGNKGGDKGGEEGG